MTQLEALLLIQKRGEQITFLKAGIITWRMLRDKDIYLSYDIARKRMSKTEAIKEVATTFDVDVNIVWRAIEKMETK